MKGTTMRTILLAAALALAGCANTTKTPILSSTPGQLFCALNTAGGGQIVVGLIDAEATAAAGPIGGPVAVLATGLAANVVQAKCAQAAANVGATAGVPVSPPASLASVPPVAVSAVPGKP